MSFPWKHLSFTTSLRLFPELKLVGNGWVTEYGPCWAVSWGPFLGSWRYEARNPARSRAQTKPLDRTRWSGASAHASCGPASEFLSPVEKLGHQNNLVLRPRPWTAPSEGDASVIHRAACAKMRRARLSRRPPFHPSVALEDVILSAI